MAGSTDSYTSVTLLERLRQNPRNEQAWAEFVRRYRPKILGWCREGGLQEADAEDVTQTVLAKLSQTMQHFQYDPAQSFRAWLKTVTHHAWASFVTSRREQGSGTSDMAARLQTIEARADLQRELEAAFDGEVLEVALQRVRDRVAPATWAAFQLTALEGRPGTEAAVQLGQGVTNIYVAKHRVQKMLQAEIRRLEGGEPNLPLPQ